MTTSAQASGERATGDQKSAVAAHTPGPWKADTIRDQDIIWSEGGTAVAQAVTKEADRSLIAAAPDMLAALKAVEEWWLSEEMGHHTGAPYAIFATRAAIAKADTRRSPDTTPQSDGR